jgi:hypothetical protein
LPDQRLKVTILPLDLDCSGPVTHPGEILTTGKSHGKKPDRFSLNIIDDDDDDNNNNNNFINNTLKQKYKHK